MLRKDRKSTKKREGHREKTVHDSVSHAKDLNKGKTISRNQIELKNIKPVSLSSNIITTVEAILASLIWLFVAYKLFEVKTLWSNIVLTLTYFICCALLYIVRLMLESKRLYGKVAFESCFYYSQKTKYNLQWSVYIFMVFFALINIVSFFFPTPKFHMTTIYIASCYYLGYIWTTQYKNDPIPYRHMETIFLIITMISNFIISLI